MNAKVITKIKLTTNLNPTAVYCGTEETFVQDGKDKGQNKQDLKKKIFQLI